ncbi:MAG: polyprenyl synthetase family protein [Steroidobacteraceae bacterium]|nr:polyprenyl synthetase family protein [Steroidobacteraceae bacterium]
MRTLSSRLEQWRSRVESELDRWLPPETTMPQRLHAAQRYSVLGPGKRIRPAFVYATAETLDIPLEHVDAAACAVELIHAYSLVHDDLPAMDDDDLRRGRPTCHKAFDEATAILAGDSLQVLAFQVLARHGGLPGDDRMRVSMIAILAEASGTAGMAGGQALDLAAEGRKLTLPEIEQVHALKTGALIRASILMAAHGAPGLAPGQLDRLDEFGRLVGLAFQVQDDILDIEGDAALIGKPVGSDLARCMPTYPAVAGLPAARDRVLELHSAAGAVLAAAGWAESPLALLADWLLARRH